MRKILIIPLLIILCAPAMAQKTKVKNRAGDFSGRSNRFHFGFTLGYNKAYFFHRLKPDFTFEDSLLSMNVNKAPGFNLGIIASMHIDNNWKLRFIPSLSFQERIFEYRFLESNEDIEDVTYRLESTNVDFPLLIKWRTNRINNWCPYVIGGAQYSIDMASNEKVTNPNEEIVKINRHDYAFSVGGGMDFFLPYFKFGIELKVNTGIPNLLIESDNRISSPISSLRSHIFLLSFTFEG